MQVPVPDGGIGTLTPTGGAKPGKLYAVRTVQRHSTHLCTAVNMKFRVHSARVACRTAAEAVQIQ